MPLNKQNNYDGNFIPYEDKIAIVEKKCTGCSFLVRGEDRHGDMILGCMYSTDLRGLNTNLREPFLTSNEIVANGCDFWNNIPPERTGKPNHQIPDELLPQYIFVS